MIVSLGTLRFYILSLSIKYNTISLTNFMNKIKKNEKKKKNEGNILKKFASFNF